MKVGQREYSEAEMMRMQRDAEERVREMQNRARQTVEMNNQGMQNMPPARNRNWNTNPNMQRRRSQQQMRRPRQHEAEPAPNPQVNPPAEEPPPQIDPLPEDVKKQTTIIEDVMSALGLDEDYLLIIGLLLILINQRADTTLVVALIYLLI